MKSLFPKTSTPVGLLIAAFGVALTACGGGGGGSASSSPPASSASPQAAANTPPAIANLPATESVAQDSNTGPVAFAVSDAESAAAGISITVASSNPELIPADAIQVAGNNADRMLLLTPMDGVAGAATITITATDSEGLSTQRPIDVTVTSTQRSFMEMVNTSFAKPIEDTAEETSGFNWVENPEEDPTAFDNLLAP